MRVLWVMVMIRRTTMCCAVAWWLLADISTGRAGRLRARVGTGSDGGGTDPLGVYFSKDKQGRTIFDYEMIGASPDDVPPTGSIDSNTDSVADPNAKSTLDVGLEDILRRQDDLQRA